MAKIMDSMTWRMCRTKSTRMLTTLLTGAAATLQFAAEAGPLAATNDAKAVFDEGRFTLPDLPNPKDAYLLVLVPTKSAARPVESESAEANKTAESPKDIRALLPGATDIKFAAGALPKGAWTWSYKVARSTPPPLDLVTPTELRLDPLDLTDAGTYPLRWTAVLGAKSYGVTGTTQVVGLQGDSPTEGRIEASCMAEFCEKDGKASTHIPVEPGTKVTWKVSARDVDGVVLAQSANATLDVEPSLLERVAAHGFAVQRSDTLSSQTAKLPALVSYSSTQEPGNPRTSAYQAQFAILYTGRDPWGDFVPRASLEARLTSSGKSKASDALIARAGATSTIWRNPGHAEATEWTTNLKYETERKEDTKKGLLELGFTPIYGPLGVYQTFPALRTSIAPIVVLGAEVGKTFTVGTSEEKKNTIVRLKTHLRLDVEFNGLARALGVRSTSAYLAGSYWYLPREDEQKNFRLGTTGLTFGLTNYLSLDLSYSVGRNAPTFAFGRAAHLGLGIKF